MKRYVALLLALFMLSNTVYAYESPSDWALDDINRAREEGIVPDFLMDGYSYATIRQEFCKLCANTLRAWGITEKGGISVSFNDLTNDNDIDPDILFCASLGIVSGMGNGKFEPTRFITRQEAAKMLCNTYRVLLESQNKHMEYQLTYPHVFKDGDKISLWARNDIYAMYHCGVMMGDTRGNFDPLGTYTREQSICTFLRLYELKDAQKTIPEYYAVGELEKILYSNYDGSCYMDVAGYDFNYIKELKPEYINSYSEHFTSDDLGFVYPIGEKYMPITVSVGAGVGKEIIINKDGEDVTSGSGVGIVYGIDGDIARVENYGFKLFDLKSRKEISVNDTTDINDIGCGMYTALYEDNDGVIFAFLDKDLKPITPKKYRYCGTALNNMTVGIDKNGNADIVDNKGNVLKTRKIDFNTYNISSIFGTNVILGNIKTSHSEILRVGSGEYIKKYDTVEFMDNGEMRADGEILDINGKPKFSIKAKGYEFVVPSYAYDDLWFGYDPESETYDVIDTNGNVMAKGIAERFIVSDGGGIFCGKTGNYSLVLFDAFGKEIGTVKTGHSIERFCFINGLLRVTSDNGVNTYYLPNGDDASFINAEIQN